MAVSRTNGSIEVRLSEETAVAIALDIESLRKSQTLRKTIRLGRFEETDDIVLDLLGVMGFDDIEVQHISSPREEYLYTGIYETVWILGNREILEYIAKHGADISAHFTSEGNAWSFSSASGKRKLNEEKFISVPESELTHLKQQETRLIKIKEALAGRKTISVSTLEAILSE